MEASCCSALPHTHQPLPHTEEQTQRSSVQHSRRAARQPITTLTCLASHGPIKCHASLGAHTTLMSRVSYLLSHLSCLTHLISRLTHASSLNSLASHPSHGMCMHASHLAPTPHKQNLRYERQGWQMARVPSDPCYSLSTSHGVL